MKLPSKVLVVTGAGSGIGRQLVLELLQRGASVAGVDINERSLGETASLASDRVKSLATYVTDISDRAAVEALPGRIAERFGAADGVINCAGIIQPFVPLTELSYETIERIFSVNWRGTLHMTKTFLPMLLQRPEAHLVNISSMGGFFPFPGQTVYGASKAAVKLLTEGLRAELANTQVRVTVVFPGAVATNITANSGVAMQPGSDRMQGKILSPDRAARIILDAVERERTRVLVGADAKMLDLVSRMSPRRASAFISRQLRRLLLPAAAP